MTEDIIEQSILTGYTYRKYKTVLKSSLRYIMFLGVNGGSVGRRWWSRRWRRFREMAGRIFFFGWVVWTFFRNRLFILLWLLILGGSGYYWYTVILFYSYIVPYSCCRFIITGGSLILIRLWFLVLLFDSILEKY